MSKPDEDAVWPNYDGLPVYDPFTVIDRMLDLRQSVVEMCRIHNERLWAKHPYATVTNIGHCFEDVGETG